MSIAGDRTATTQTLGAQRAVGGASARHEATPAGKRAVDAIQEVSIQTICRNGLHCNYWGAPCVLLLFQSLIRERRRYLKKTPRRKTKHNKLLKKIEERLRWFSRFCFFVIIDGYYSFISMRKF